jgi:hypothetical protein
MISIIYMTPWPVNLNRNDNNDSIVHDWQLSLHATTHQTRQGRICTDRTPSAHFSSKFKAHLRGGQFHKSPVPPIGIH